VFHEPLSIRYYLGAVRLILYLTTDLDHWSIQHVSWHSKQDFTTSQMKVGSLLRIWRRSKRLSVPAEVFDILTAHFVLTSMLFPQALRIVLEKLAGGCLLNGAQPMNLESWQSALVAVLDM
jgi:hypothetical protein